MDNCIFCQIVAGEMPCHKVWEDEKHMAFLSPFPNTDGFTVVITKNHYGSYAFDQDDEVLSGLILATKQVAMVLDNYFDDVARCGMFFEGYGIDHLHTKLFPMHGTADKDWMGKEHSRPDEFYEKYPGYLSSHDYKKADDEKLSKLAQEIRESQV